MVSRLLILSLCMLFTANAYASIALSPCSVKGIVKSVGIDKIHFKVLNKKGNGQYNACSELSEKLLTFYDNNPVEGSCGVKVLTSFTDKWKDNVQKGDTLEFEYNYYSAMGPNGFVCQKKWVLINHTPFQKKSSRY